MNEKDVPEYMLINGKPAWHVDFADLDKAEMQDMLQQAYLDICKLKKTHNNYKAQKRLQIEDLQDEISNLKDAQEKQLADNAEYKQMQQLVEQLDKQNKQLAESLKHAQESREELLKRLNKQQKEKHNARGAGRKPKLTGGEQEQIYLEYAAGNTSIRALAQKYSISTGMVQRIIKKMQPK